MAGHYNSIRTGGIVHHGRPFARRARRQQSSSEDDDVDDESDEEDDDDSDHDDSDEDDESDEEDESDEYDDEEEWDAAMAQQQQDHPIFSGIFPRGDLAAVQQYVLADGAVLGEREGIVRMTPLMWAIFYNKPAIALWLVQHRGQHDLEMANGNGQTASYKGLLEVVQALVAAGADPAAVTVGGYTPLMTASNHSRTNIVAFLLQLPAVRATIDHIAIGDRRTTLSAASRMGHQPIVQLLLDAGAALLRHAIGEADRVRLCVALMGKEKGLCGNLYRKVLGYMVPAWVHKGPDA